MGSSGSEREGGSAADRPVLLRGLSLGLQIGLSVALPLVALSLGGRWLDARAGTFPLFFLLGLLGASGLGILLVALSVARATRS